MTFFGYLWKLTFKLIKIGFLLPCSSPSPAALVPDLGCCVLGYSKHWQHLLEISVAEPGLAQPDVPTEAIQAPILRTH